MCYFAEHATLQHATFSCVLLLAYCVLKNSIPKIGHMCATFSIRVLLFFSSEGAPFDVLKVITGLVKRIDLVSKSAVLVVQFDICGTIAL